MKRIIITSGQYTWLAVLQEELAPQTCDWFMQQLPYHTQFLQGRWSGKAVFSRLGTSAAHLPPENATVYPQTGQIVLYPGGERGVQGGGEIYMPYGANAFACEYGKLAGNPLLAIIEGGVLLPAYGETVYTQGVQDVLFELEN